MNRIDRAFARTREEGRAALIPFLTAGDPDLATTAELVAELERAGADIVEIGFPHSDPIAEGPVIQASSLRTLRKGASLAQVLDVVKRVREVSEVPIILMGSLNNVLAYGERALPKAAAERGVDGLLVSDAPFEETTELQDECEACGIHRILMVAPTSTPERVVRIAHHAKGFVYCVSAVGVTGERATLAGDLEELVQRVRRVSDQPIAVGFGIGSPEQAAEVARMADGVIVGSALVRRIGDAATPAAAIEAASSFVASLATAVRNQAQLRGRSSL